MTSPLDQPAGELTSGIVWKLREWSTGLLVVLAVLIAVEGLFLRTAIDHLADAQRAISQLQKDVTLPGVQSNADAIRKLSDQLKVDENLIHQQQQELDQFKANPPTKGDKGDTGATGATGKPGPAATAPPDIEPPDNDPLLGLPCPVPTRPSC